MAGAFGFLIIWDLKMNDPYEIIMGVPDDYCQGFDPTRFLPPEDEEDEIPSEDSFKLKPIRIKRER